MPGPLRDSFGRTLDYLRISVTDACNFRCVYCLPPEGVVPAYRRALLSGDEILRLAGVFTGLGIRRIRLTGGEPLLKADIVPLVKALSTLPGLRHLALTTNGSELGPLALPLKKAGLEAVNISLDSLQADRFRRITNRHRLDDVLRGLNRALEAGLGVKINVMALSDLTREEVLAFCLLALEHPVTVRFLEFMPLCGDAWAPKRMLPMARIKAWVSEAHELSSLPRGRHPAETFAVRGAPGKIGFIASLSEPFCTRCNRLRLTASGVLHLCLFSPAGTDLRTPMRNGASDGQIAATIREAVRGKPESREALAGRDSPRIRLMGG